MVMLRRWLTGSSLPVWAFAGWTLFVWGNRLVNISQDPGGFSSAGFWTLATALTFVALGLVLGFANATRSGLLAPIVGLLAALTIGVWLIRGVDIALGDHSVPFIAVHLVLAVVSIGLSVWAWRSLAGVGDGTRVTGDRERASAG